MLQDIVKRLADLFDQLEKDQISADTAAQLSEVCSGLESNDMDLATKAQTKLIESSWSGSSRNWLPGIKNLVTLSKKYSK